MNVGDAFRAVIKQQCGYVAGEATALRTLMLALRRDRKAFEFAPVWFSDKQTHDIGAPLLDAQRRYQEEADRERTQQEEERRRRERQREAIEENSGN